MPTPEKLPAMLKRINTAPAWDAKNVQAEAKDYIAKHPEDEFLVRWAMTGYAHVVEAAAERSF